MKNQQKILKILSFAWQKPKMLRLPSSSTWRRCQLGKGGGFSGASLRDIVHELEKLHFRNIPMFHCVPLFHCWTPHPTVSQKSVYHFFDSILCVLRSKSGRPLFWLTVLHCSYLQLLHPKDKTEDLV